MNEINAELRAAPSAERKRQLEEEQAAIKHRQDLHAQRALRQRRELDRLIDAERNKGVYSDTLIIHQDAKTKTSLPSLVQKPHAADTISYHCGEIVVHNCVTNTSFVVLTNPVRAISSLFLGDRLECLHPLRIQAA